MAPTTSPGHTGLRSVRASWSRSRSRAHPERGPAAGHQGNTDSPRHSVRATQTPMGLQYAGYVPVDHSSLASFLVVMCASRPTSDRGRKPCSLKGAVTGYTPEPVESCRWSPTRTAQQVFSNRSMFRAAVLFRKAPQDTPGSRPPPKQPVRLLGDARRGDEDAPNSYRE